MVTQLVTSYLGGLVKRTTTITQEKGETINADKINFIGLPLRYKCSTRPTTIADIMRGMSSK